MWMKRFEKNCITIHLIKDLIYSKNHRIETGPVAADPKITFMSF